MKVDHRTWCDDSIKAGIILANILEDMGDEKLVGKVNTHINRFTRRLNTISYLNNDRNYFMLLLLKDARKHVNDSEFPKNVKTHLLNVLTTKYRQKLT